MTLEKSDHNKPKAIRGKKTINSIVKMNEMENRK